MAKSIKTLSLPSIVDLDALDTVRDQLLEALESGGGVTVLGTDVERVSTNALFMLLSAAETARHNEYPFEVKAPSDSLVAAIDRLGLAEPFAGVMEGY